MKRHHKDRRPLTAPTPAMDAPPPKRSWMSKIGEVSLAIAEAQRDGMIPRRPFVAPALPPGVVPKGAKFALDSSSAQQAFTWMNQQPGFCGLGFPGYPYLSELSQRSEYRAPTETLANEMTREWIQFTGAEEGKLKELEQAFEDFNVQACFRQMALQDGFFGRGQLYIHVKGQDTDQRRRLPLVLDKEGRALGKGQLLGFKAVEPIWTTPYMYNSIDPTAPDFYSPQAWYIMGKQTHTSRLLTFVSRPLPDMLKPAYNFGGMSLTQLVEPYVIRWLKTVDSVNRLISNFSIIALATSMSSTLEDAGDANSLFKRAQLFNQIRDNRGLMLLDKESEDLLQKNTPLSGLSELQAQAQEHMAAPTHIPLVKLTGITPNGLNASSEGEIKVFYDWVGSEQENQYTPNLNMVLKAVQLHLWGKIDPKIKAEWIPLDSPSDKELAQMRKTDGDRDVAYVSGGVVSADEVRERLRNDKHSGYTFLEGDAPPSPLEQQHELGQESADADHQRGEASAEAAHERDMEKDTVDKLSLDEWDEGKHPRGAGGQFGSGGSGAASKPRLTPTEKTFLSSYSGDDFLRINQELRSGNASDGAVKHLDAAINKATVSEGATLFRGMDRDAAKKLFPNGEISVGQTITDKAYQSTSASYDVAHRIGGVVLKIVAGKNAKGLNMDGLARNELEKETLLPRDAKMKVNRIVKGKTAVMVEVSYGD